MADTRHWAYLPESDIDCPWMKPTGFDFPTEWAIPPETPKAIETKPEAVREEK